MGSMHSILGHPHSKEQPILKVSTLQSDLGLLLPSKDPLCN
jgi:hypothetical protein